MISLRRIRAVGVVSALFGVSAAVITATVNFGTWLLSPPPLPRSSTFLYIFATVPVAFSIGCLIGVAFSALLFVRRARSGEKLRTRWLVSAGLVGGAAVGLVGSFLLAAPYNLHISVVNMLTGVGVFSLVGAGTAGLVGRIARGRDALRIHTSVDETVDVQVSLNAAAWSHVRETPKRESDPRVVR